MKPAPFDYYSPRSLEEALELLAAHGDRARILAGGQSLAPLMHLRQTRPAVLVDLGKIPGLNAIEIDDGVLRLGAMLRQSTIESSPRLWEHCPLLPEATRHIGFRAVRNRGTLGGSLAHADPGAELPLILTCLDGEVVVQGLAGRRVVRAGDLFVGSFRTSLASGEILVEVRLPISPPTQRRAFLELDRRYPSHTVVAVAVTLDMDAAGICQDARIALGGVASTPIRAPAAESLLLGRAPDPALLDEAAAVASADLRPADELHAPASYKRAMARVFVARALRQAAGGNGGDPDAS